MPASPAFEVVTPASTDDRLLISVATIRDLTDIPSSVSDDKVRQMILAALSQAASVCDLAKGRGVSPTLAREVVRATWRSPSGRRWYGSTNSLLLPWRVPITAISVTDGNNTLVENADYQLNEAGMLERVGAGWSTGGNIVVDYTAGWLAMDELPATDGMMPPDLVSLFADQVRMMNDRAAVDLNLRSETIDGLGAWQWNVAGGDAVDDCGLMGPLYEALVRGYRAPPIV